MSIITTMQIEEAKSAISRAVDRANAIGYTDGHDDGYAEGFREGATSNDEEVFNEGYNTGYIDGSEVADGQLEEEYQNGYEDGKSSMIDEDKIIIKTATGTGVVALDDVSELPHNISVKLSSDTITDFSGKKVTVYGKNLLDQSQELKLIFNGVSYGYSLSLPTGRYTVSAKRLKESTGDYIYIPSSLNYLTRDRQIIAATQQEDVVVDLKEGTPLRIYEAGKKSLAEAKKIFARYALQVEAGGNVTPVEPYIAPTTYTANADGTIEGIKSISPYMTFVCEDGIDISVTYRADWGMITTREAQWNGFTNYGTRTAYPYGFHSGYLNGYPHPLTDVNVEGSTTTYMFYASKILDLSACFKRYNTKLNTSEATTLNSMFSVAKTLVVPEISLVGLTASTGTYNMFNTSDVRIIEMLVFKDDGTTPIASNMFTGASNLKEIRVRGTIGQTISFGSSPLSRESMLNIFEHFSTTASGVTATFKKSAVESAFTDDEWNELVATRPNWTISKA